MGWNATAKAAAAEQYGRANWQRYAARQKAGTWLVVGAVALLALAWLVRAGLHAAGPHVAGWRLPAVAWGHWTVVGLWVLSTLLLARTAVRLRSPYRLPRRYRRR
jgi:hypothetical protein